MQRHTEGTPILHLRTGEPGAGATLHTIYEISQLHPNKVVLYSNIDFIKLPNWKKIDLPEQMILNTAGSSEFSKDSVIFIDDFHLYSGLSENLEQFIKIITDKEIIAYFVAGRVDNIFAETMQYIVPYINEHTHFEVFDNAASLRISLPENRGSLITERMLRKQNSTHQLNSKSPKKLLKTHAFFNTSLFGRYSQ